MAKEEATARNWKDYAKPLLPFTAMIAVECVEMGLITLSKAAMLTGMSNFIFVVYYNALGTLILLPILLLHSFRAESRPVTFTLLWKFFFLGLIGICVLQICAYIGINYSNPTLAAAMGNLIPIFTFLLAVALRMERLNMKEWSSKVKFIGAIVAITGAFIVTLYRGPAVLGSRQQQQHSHPLLHSGPQPLLSAKQNWLLGSFFLAITCISSSMWNIFQAKTAIEYPHKLKLVFYYSFFGTLQSAVCSFFLEKDPSAWKLHSRIEVIAIVYAGVFVTVFRNTVVTWCLRERGPVYVAMFKPLSVVIAALMSVLILRETLYLGSLVGAATIATGFYAVIWGQAEEMSLRQKACFCTESNRVQSPKTTPLLQTPQS